ncbi:anti-sigma factor family protein [Streptomyces sp. NPDC017943]|uniref:anti-sigma factor family protein n=1 Tax=Streptomyces sp. NPDC017943 TaxID=3365019 RepID=UPI0037BC8F65
MRCEQEKAELTVYALDALEADDVERVGDHVRNCSACAMALHELKDTLTTLRSLPDEDILGDWDGKIPELSEAAVRAAAAEVAAAQELSTPNRTEGENPSGRVQNTGRPEKISTRPLRARPQRSWALAAAAAGVLLGFGSSFLLPGGDDGAATGSTLARPSGDAVVRAVGTQGVAAAIEPRSTGWGTEVTLDLSGVRGPERCALVAVSREGVEETAFTWRVPEGGYGLPGSAKERLLARGGISMSAQDVSKYVIRTADGQDLVDVPAVSAS